MKLKINLLTFLTLSTSLIMLSCGDDNSNPTAGSGGQVLPASTKMHAGVMSAFTQTQSTSVLGDYPDAPTLVDADTGCTFIPDHLSNLYYYGNIGNIWNSHCFDSTDGGPKGITTKGYVSRLLDPSIANIGVNGPNVLNSLESKLLIPCIMSLVLPPDKYDDNGLPEPREEPYVFTITQEIIDSAEVNCGGLLGGDLLGIDMTLKVEDIGTQTDNFYIKAQLDKSRDGEALETSFFYFGTNVVDSETGNPYLNVGWQTRPDNPISLGYALLIYKAPGKIRFEQMVEYNSSQISPPNYEDPCNKVNFFRAYIDEENTFMVGQSNHNPHTMYTLSGSQKNFELNTTKISLWSPYSFEQDKDKESARYPWTSPVNWSEMVYPYNGCIDNPTGITTTCTLEPRITPIGLESVVGNRLAIMADSLDPSKNWYNLTSSSDLKFTDDAAVFTAEPFGDIDVEAPADCPYPPTSLDKFPWGRR